MPEYPGLIISKEKGWTTYRQNGVFCAGIGRRASIEQLMGFISSEGEPDLNGLSGAARNLPGHWAIVARAQTWILAVTDKIRSYPLFYVEKDPDFIISNCAHSLLEKQKDPEIDPDSLVELKMAGYVTGRSTVYRHLYQMRAGEMIFKTTAMKTSVSMRYYLFYDSKTDDNSENELIEKLDGFTDNIFKRHMEDAGGKPIWVPLSGGLDSRLVLCKLKQLQYGNIKTYSYGVKGNHDALRAGEIAGKLGIEWSFLPTSPDEARQFFNSAQRKAFWAFSDGLHVVPNLHGMFAINTLFRAGKIKPGDVIINGQSGDFITGQHIPDVPVDKNMNPYLFDVLIRKHFNMRKNLLRDDGSIAVIKDRITAVIEGQPDMEDEQIFAKIYELWEWQERQSKRVINGQQNYDFFGLKWELPLWENEYLHFWQRVPLHHKKGRRLFVRYVEKLNFFNLFKTYQAPVSRWPKGRRIIQNVGRGLKLILGEQQSKKWYRKFDRYSQYGYLYECLPHEYAKHWMDYKSPLAYFTDVWISENLKNREK